MLTVFIVEDDVDVSDSLRAVVKAIGHSCHTFDSAEAILQHWNGSDCDCLIVDVDLPEMSGIELLQTLRQSGSNTPAVFYTGRTDGRIRCDAKLLGDIPIVQKGSDPEDIENCLRLLLRDSSTS